MLSEKLGWLAPSITPMSTTLTEGYKTASNREARVRDPNPNIEAYTLYQNGVS
jgi:hypothetical protein